MTKVFATKAAFKDSDAVVDRSNVKFKVKTVSETVVTSIALKWLDFFMNSSYM